jgi:hypothetical protein
MASQHTILVQPKLQPLYRAQASMPWQVGTAAGLRCQLAQFRALAAGAGDRPLYLMLLTPARIAEALDGLGEIAIHTPDLLLLRLAGQAAPEPGCPRPPG